MRNVILDELWALSRRLESASVPACAPEPEIAHALVGSYASAQSQLRDVLVADPPVCPTRFAILSTAIDRAYVTGVLSRPFRCTTSGQRSLSAR